jgi:PPOX class probable F420-dependent enzyme
MTEMTDWEIKRFLMKGTFTGKLATVGKDGNSHVVPIWFVLEDRPPNGKIGDIYFTTGTDSYKAQNIRHNNSVSLCVDDQEPPFSFVFLRGKAKIFPYKQKEAIKWATRIAARYMGKKKSALYGKTNGGEGTTLIRIRPKRIIAEKDIAILDQ